MTGETSGTDVAVQKEASGTVLRIFFWVFPRLGNGGQGVIESAVFGVMAFAFGKPLGGRKTNALAPCQLWSLDKDSDTSPLVAILVYRLNSCAVLWDPC